LFLTIPETQITRLFLCFLHKILGFLHIAKYVAVSSTSRSPPAADDDGWMMVDGLMWWKVQTCQSVTSKIAVAAAAADLTNITRSLHLRKLLKNS